MPKYSVIIPAYNAVETLTDTVNSIRNARDDVEIILVDGMSQDNTCQLARSLGLTVLQCRRSRGFQLNRGALMSSGKVLLFLHADTSIPKNTFKILDKYLPQSGLQAATFKLKFDIQHWLLEFYSRMSKYDSIWTTFGDQCIISTRELYYNTGGFPNWPLFEDVKFLQEVRKLTKVYCLPAYVTTSAKRYVKKGFLKQQLRNGLLIVQYLFGVSPQALKQQYDHQV